MRVGEVARCLSGGLSRVAGCLGCSGWRVQGGWLSREPFLVVGELFQPHFLLGPDFREPPESRLSLKHFIQPPKRFPRFTSISSRS